MTDQNFTAATGKPQPTPSESLFAQRLDGLERDNVRLRRLSVYLLIGGGALLGLAAAFVVVAARHGMPGFVPELAEARQFALRDAQGRVRAVLGTTKEGNVQFMLQDVGGRDRLRLSVLPDGGAGVAFVDSAGRSRMVLGLLPDQSASVVLADPGGKTRTVLGLGANGSSTIIFADKGGTARAGLGVDTRGVGTFTLLDRNGSDLAASQDASGDVPPPDTAVALEFFQRGTDHIEPALDVATLGREDQQNPHCDERERWVDPEHGRPAEGLVQLAT